MTCIVGLVEGGKVYMGGDSSGVSSWTLTIRADEKVFCNGEFLIGFTTSFRMGQLLRYAFTPPPIEGDLFAYMVTQFVTAVRACLKEGGYAKKENEQEEGGTFLVGVRGRLFAVCGDYQVVASADNYAAIGSGEDIALGALCATYGDLPPRLCIERALSAAERHNIGVRGPFTVLYTGAPVAVLNGAHDVAEHVNG